MLVTTSSIACTWYIPVSWHWMLQWEKSEASWICFYLEYLRRIKKLEPQYFFFIAVTQDMPREFLFWVVFYFFLSEISALFSCRFSSWFIEVFFYDIWQMPLCLMFSFAETLICYVGFLLSSMSMVFLSNLWKSSYHFLGNAHVLIIAVSKVTPFYSSFTVAYFFLKHCQLTFFSFGHLRISSLSSFFS